MKAYQSTAAQARFADSLGEQVGDDVFETCFAQAAKLNGNTPWSKGSSRIQATRRLSKKAASKLIDSLLDAKNAIA